MTSLKQPTEYFHFRLKIQLDLPCIYKENDDKRIICQTVKNILQVEMDVEDLYIVSCRASGGGTMLMSDQGHIYAAGVNR